jgi:hypothetical protein
MAMEIKFMPNGLSLVHQPVEVQIPSTVLNNSIHSRMYLNVYFIPPGITQLKKNYSFTRV